MAVRVDQLVPYGYTDTAISTFHAFGDRLIREYALELGPAHGPAGADPRRRSSSSCASTCSSSTSTRTGRWATRPASWPRSPTLFSRCKDEDIAPADYLAHADRVAAEAARVAEAAGRGSRRPRGRGRRRRGGPPPGRAGPRLRHVPGADGRQRLHRLRRPGGARAPPRPHVGVRPGRAIAGRFRYILVDEFQDTNRAQAELVAALADGHRNVTVVGDDDQAIYAFRGAAVDNILAFQDRYLGARTVVLRRNYRSLAPVLDAAYRLIRFNDPDRLEVRTGIVKRLRAAARLAGRPARPAGGLRLGRGGGGLDRRRDRPADRGRRRAPRSRRPRPRQRPCRPDPAGAQHGRHPVAVLGHVRAVRPARGATPARVPAGRRRPRLERRRVRARGVGRLPPRRRGPDRDRDHGAPAEPLDLGGARGARPAAGDPAGRPRDPRRPSHKLVADLRQYAQAAHEVPAGELLYRFLRASGLLREPGRDGHAGRRGAAPEHRPVLRDRPVAVGAAGRRSRRRSWRRTWRPSSRRATTRPPRSSIPTRTRSPC